jgi:uncharacterized protein
MKCPNCNETLVMADRQGIEIDYCPACRGVWLDRGELDKIIDRTANYVPPPQDTDTRDHTYQQPQQPYPPQDSRYNDPYNKYNDPHYKHKKKKGFLSDFFDFD